MWKLNSVRDNLIGLCMADSNLLIFKIHFQDRFMEVVLSNNLRTILGIL